MSGGFKSTQYQFPEPREPEDSAPLSDDDYVASLEADLDEARAAFQKVYDLRRHTLDFPDDALSILDEISIVADDALRRLT